METVPAVQTAPHQTLNNHFSKQLQSFKRLPTNCISRDECQQDRFEDYNSDQQDIDFHITDAPQVTSRSKLIIFSEDWIYDHLRELNRKQEPVVEIEDIAQVLEYAVIRLGHLLGRPLVEVWEEARGVLLEILFCAKLAVEEGQGKDFGLERIEEVQDEDFEAQIGGSVQDVKMDANMLGQFLVAINGFMSVRNEAQLADWLVLEPPFADHYSKMIQQLRSNYPKGSEDALDKKCCQSLPAAQEAVDDGPPWTQFVKFMVQYLSYLRDVDMDPNKYLETYRLLSALQVRVNSALAHQALGYLILPIAIGCARLVCRLAIGLDKQPELIAHLKSAGQAVGGEDSGQRETLPEQAANTIRTAFVTCLNDRMSGLGKDGAPEGKKRGVYIIANLCLKILFQCRKTRNATQIFENIYNQSPPLSAYPKRERVTYLYYLGRFLFQNSHFYRGQLALQYAYDESPARPECARQRRHILVYLIASNIILGRFPSEALLSRPEAQGLAERFLPICYAIRSGDLAAFRQHLDIDGQHADWFLHFRILLQLRNRCEVLVWRSLIRKTWILVGTRPSSDPGNRAAATVSINDLVAAFAVSGNQRRLSSSLQSDMESYIDPDFTGLELPSDDSTQLDTMGVESILSSLIDQGLLGGFISHKQLKFAITGSKAKGGPLAAGFPQPWDSMRVKAESGSQAEVPGWKKESRGGMPAGGMVIHLSGARPVGAAG